MEGLCVVLQRFAYPCRYSDLKPRLRRPVLEISMITTEVINFIYETNHHWLTNWNDALLFPVSLQRYADAILLKGDALDNCFAFISGTARPICCPSGHQMLVHNDHNRMHALKFQSLTLPNRMVGHLYGPVGTWNSKNTAKGCHYYIQYNFLWIFNQSIFYLAPNYYKDYNN